MTLERIDKGGEIRVSRNPNFKSPSKHVTGGAFILGDIKEFVQECELAGAMDNTIVVANITDDTKTTAKHCSYLSVATEMGLPKIAEPVPAPWHQNPFRVGAVVSMAWIVFMLLMVVL